MNIAWFIVLHSVSLCGLAYAFTVRTVVAIDDRVWLLEQTTKHMSIILVPHTSSPGSD